MAGQRHFFVAYASNPPQIATAIEPCASELSLVHPDLKIQTWPNNDIFGKFVAEEVMHKIDSCDAFVADITKLNPNVTFEFGFALAKRKPVLLIVNPSLSPQTREVGQLGIFDTVGHKNYENSTDLAKLLADYSSWQAISIVDRGISKETPVYLLDTLHKTDASIRIISKIKKARIKYRSFDPKEQSRLSLEEAYSNTAQSVAIVLQLLSHNATDHFLNNLRASLLAGLAHGLGKELIMFQEGDDPVPLDYRDLVATYRAPTDVDDYINDLAPKVVEALQQHLGDVVPSIPGLLAAMDLGSPAAENEMSTQYCPVKK